LFSIFFVFLPRPKPQKEWEASRRWGPQTTIEKDICAVRNVEAKKQNAHFLPKKNYLGGRYVPAQHFKCFSLLCEMAKIRCSCAFAGKINTKTKTAKRSEPERAIRHFHAVSTSNLPVPL